MPPTRIDHTNTICCICGDNYTSSVWYRHDKEKGKSDRKSYRCAKCNMMIKRSMITKIKDKKTEDIKKDIKCRRCHIDIVSTKKYRYYNEKGEWDKRSYICNRCYIVLYHAATPEEIENYREYKRKRRKCCVCGEIESNNWYICRCCKKDCAGHVCLACYTRDYNDQFVKTNTLCRTGGIIVGSCQYLAIISQAVVAKYLKIDDLNIKMNNFEWFIDMEDEKYGKIDVKSGRLTISRIYEVWEFGTKRKIDCHFYFCIGFSRDLKVIDAVYLIPNEGWICSLDTIMIRKYPTRVSKYDQFRVDQESYNDIYQKLVQFLKGKKLIDIDDIKEWLGTN